MEKKEILRTIKFALVSASAGIIELGVFTLLNEVFKLPYWGSYLTGLVLSILWNFTINRKFTFKSATNVPIAMLKVFAFYIVFTPLSTLLENYLTMSLGWNEYVVTIINMLMNFVLEFIYQRFYVFKDSIDTNELAKEDKKEI